MIPDRHWRDVQFLAERRFSARTIAKACRISEGRVRYILSRKGLSLRQFRSAVSSARKELR